MAPLRVSDRHVALHGSGSHERAHRCGATRLSYLDLPCSFCTGSLRFFSTLQEASHAYAPLADLLLYSFLQTHTRFCKIVMNLKAMNTDLTFSTGDTMPRGMDSTAGF
eukprot:155015-Pleurochrysis_carterae.AAC.1